jgi:hypothetical protein
VAAALLDSAAAQIRDIPLAPTKENNDVFPKVLDNWRQVFNGLNLEIGIQVAAVTHV